jgi:hypothetical protein
MEHMGSTIEALSPQSRPTTTPEYHWAPPDLGDRGSRERDRALTYSDVL